MTVLDLCWFYVTMAVKKDRSPVVNAIVTMGGCMTDCTTHQELRHEIHERIASVIINSGYSYESIAFGLGFESKGTVGKWVDLRHDTLPDLATIVALARMLDVNVDYLLCLTDEKTSFYIANPIDWSVLEEHPSNRCHSFNNVYETLRDMDKRNRRKFRRSNVGQTFRRINSELSVLDKFKLSLTNDASTKNQHDSRKHA